MSSSTKSKWLWFVLLYIASIACVGGFIVVARLLLGLPV